MALGGCPIRETGGNWAICGAGPIRSRDEELLLAASKRGPVGARNYLPCWSASLSSAKTETSDKPVKDSGGNFGRVARVHGLMEEFIADALRTLISGIEARYWIDFFKVFTDASDEDQIAANMARLLARESLHAGESVAEDIMRHLLAINSVLSGERPSDAG